MRRARRRRGRRVLDVLMRPYDDGDDHFADAPPPTMKDLCVT